MTDFVIVYLILTAWFWLADMLAAEIAESPSRPVAGFLLALIWPLSQVFALLACAAIFKRMKSRIAELES